MSTENTQPSDESIFDLWKKVQEHPDYVFGTIFVTGDFKSEDDVERFFDENLPKHVTDQLVSIGNEFIYDFAPDEHCGD